MSKIVKESPSEIERSISIAGQKMQFATDLIMIFLGFTLLLLCLAMIYFQVPIHGPPAVWFSAVVALAVASMTAGIAGSLTVEYRHNNLILTGSLGLGAFLLVFLASLRLIV